jgi:hypothetical protein
VPSRQLAEAVLKKGSCKEGKGDVGRKEEVYSMPPTAAAVERKAVSAAATTAAAEQYCHPPAACGKTSFLALRTMSIAMRQFLAAAAVAMYDSK